MYDVLDSDYLFKEGKEDLSSGVEVLVLNPVREVDRVMLRRGIIVSGNKISEGTLIRELFKVMPESLLIL